MSQICLAKHQGCLANNRLVKGGLSWLQEEFLAAMRELQPDLCVTAAYGNILPKEFLDIPKFGTVNIHPSLLPKYRGAAPVQRALQVIQQSVYRIGCTLFTQQ